MKTYHILQMLAALAVWKSDAHGWRVLSAQRAQYTAKKIQESLLPHCKTPGHGNYPLPHQRADLLFVLDRSRNIGSTNFQHAIKFIIGFLNHYSISPSTSRVALISYALKPRVEFNFAEHWNKECLTKAIKKVKFSGGYPATGSALLRAQNLYNDSNSGARPGLHRIIFLITNGLSNIGSKPKEAARALRAAYWKTIIFAIGIGQNVNTNALLDIAVPLNVLKAKNFKELEGVLQHLGLNCKLCTDCKIRYDECGRRCECKCGKLVNCYRVRKEFTSMSDTERRRYITTIKLVSTKQPYKAKYDKLITIHFTEFFKGIHKTDQFLPWHRWFVFELENLLREIDCRVTVPYWDWSLWAHDPWRLSSPSLWHASTRGFGGNGAPPHSCVNTGPFREAVWSITTGQCLRREFHGSIPDPAEVQFGINMDDFNSFESYLRINLHNTVHCRIDGTMCSLDAANAPEFFLHHGFVDKIWNEWQQKSIVNKYAHFLTINRKLNSSPYYPRDLIDIADLPKCVKVTYDEATVNKAEQVRAYLRTLSNSQISARRRVPATPLSKKGLQLFRVPRAEQQRARAVQKLIFPPSAGAWGMHFKWRHNRMRRVM